MFWNGKMAIDGLSGSGSGAGSAEAAGGAASAASMRDAMGVQPAGRCS